MAYGKRKYTGSGGIKRRKIGKFTKRTFSAPSRRSRPTNNSVWIVAL